MFEWWTTMSQEMVKVTNVQAPRMNVPGKSLAIPPVKICSFKPTHLIFYMVHSQYPNTHTYDIRYTYLVWFNHHSPSHFCLVENCWCFAAVRGDEGYRALYKGDPDLELPLQPERWWRIRKHEVQGPSNSYFLIQANLHYNRPRVPQILKAFLVLYCRHLHNLEQD